LIICIGDITTNITVASHISRAPVLNKGEHINDEYVNIETLETNITKEKKNKI
jgi:hypothetical protein